MLNRCLEGIQPLNKDLTYVLTAQIVDRHVVKLMRTLLG